MDTHIVVEVVPVSRLTPYSGNPMVHPDEQVRELAAAIKEFGFKNPIVADADGVIITGHGRLMAAKLLGLEEVPVVFARDLSAAQVRALRIADNRLARKSTYDLELLADEISLLTQEDFNTELLGFSEDEIEALLGTDFIPDGDFRVSESTRQSAPPERPAAAQPREAAEQLRKEPEVTSGQLVEVGAPKATDDQHSVFDCVMQHSEKVRLVKVLDRLRAEHGYKKLSEALMHMVRQFE